MSFSKVDWFSEHADKWTRFLLPTLHQAGASALMLGSYDGRSARWLLDHSPHLNRLDVVEPNDTPACVWHKDVATYNGDVIKNLRTNTRDPRVKKVIVGKSYAEVLRRPPASAYDAIAVDARGNSRITLEALVLAWPLLKRGGVMCVTNYTMSAERDARCPRRGIDSFLDSYSDDLQVMHTGWHVFVRRRSTPMAVGPCRSEYFPAQQMGEPDCGAHRTARNARKTQARASAKRPPTSKAGVLS